MLGHASAHCALEYHRWGLRSILRTDGRRFQELMRHTIHVPVLQIHGANDPSVTARSAELSHEFVSGPYTLKLMEGIGHFPQEEAPDEFSKSVIDWLGTIPGYER